MIVDSIAGSKGKGSQCAERKLAQAVMLLERWCKRPRTITPFSTIAVEFSRIHAENVWQQPASESAAPSLPGLGAHWAGKSQMSS